MPKRKPVVYFVEMVGQGAVKIGTSVDPFHRKARLQENSVHRLRLRGFVPGHLRRERQFHRRFAAYRIRNEWFRLDGALREFVDTLSRHPTRCESARNDEVMIAVASGALFSGDEVRDWVDVSLFDTDQDVANWHKTTVEALYERYGPSGRHPGTIDLYTRPVGGLTGIRECGNADKLVAKIEKLQKG